MYSFSMNLITLKKLMLSERGLYLEADHGFFLHWPNGQSAYLASLEHPFQIGHARPTPSHGAYAGIVLTGLRKTSSAIAITPRNGGSRMKASFTLMKEAAGTRSCKIACALGSCAAMKNMARVV